MELEKITIKGETFVLVPNRIFNRMVEAIENEKCIEVAKKELQKPELGIPGGVFHKIVLNNENPIKVYREYRKLSQLQLAKKVGVTESYISQIENGKRAGTTKILKLIAQVLGVTIDDII
jgi:DNA-binding XRE family transcriptional regulator